MLCVLRQTDTAGVWNDGYTILLCNEQYSKDFVDTANSAGVYLADVNSTLYDQLLEYDAVLAHLARCYADAVRLQSVADSFMPENVVRRVDRLWHAPHLVGVNHEDVALVVANNVASNGETLLVLLKRCADLQLEVLLKWLLLLQHLYRLFRSNSVCQVYHTFFWPDPTQVAVADEVTPCLSPVCHEVFQLLALDPIAQNGNSLADDLVAAANGEGHAMSLVLCIRLENNVGGGVIASCVHGIAASLVQGGLEQVWSALIIESLGMCRLLTGKRQSRVVAPVMVTMTAHLDVVLASQIATTPSRPYLCHPVLPPHLPTAFTFSRGSLVNGFVGCPTEGNWPGIIMSAAKFCESIGGRLIDQTPTPGLRSPKFRRPKTMPSGTIPCVPAIRGNMLRLCGLV
ncbi:L-galactonate [Hortaea werneckii]|nr:L-galactonate [Hortaea werneckii]